jgi:hypothetical protein
MRTQTHTMRSPPHSNPSAPQRLSGRHLPVRVVDLCCGMGGLSVPAREMGMRVVAGREERCSVVGGRCWKVFGDRCARGG